VSKNLCIVLKDLPADSQVAMPERHAVLCALLNLRCASIELLEHRLLNYTPHDELRRNIVCASFIDATDEFDRRNVVRVCVHHAGSDDGWSSELSVQLCWFDDNLVDVAATGHRRLAYENCTPQDVNRALFLSPTFDIERHMDLIIETLFVRINATLVAEQHRLASDVDSFLHMFSYDNLRKK